MNELLLSVFLFTNLSQIIKLFLSYFSFNKIKKELINPRSLRLFAENCGEEYVRRSEYIVLEESTFNRIFVPIRRIDHDWCDDRKQK